MARKEPLFPRHYDNDLMYNFLKRLRWEFSLRGVHKTKSGNVIVYPERIEISNRIWDELQKL